MPLKIIITDLPGIDRDVAGVNFDVHTSFNLDKNPSKPYRYAEAFLFIMLPFGAFHQINYVCVESFRLISSLKQRL